MLDEKLVFHASFVTLSLTMFLIFFPFQVIAEGDAIEGKKQATICVTCHGANGISSQEIWPNLAGQKYNYLVKQLKAFRDGNRKEPSMEMMVGSLSDREIENIASFFSSIQLTANVDEGLLASKTAQPIVAQDVSPDVNTGSELYTQNCVFCHQADAIGKPGTAPSLTNKELLSSASDAFFFDTIRDGRPGTGMPPFAHLGEDKIKAIIAFLRDHTDQANLAAEIDAQPAAKGDPAHGEQLFELICSTCHGERGDGYASGGTGTAIGKLGFLSKVSDGFIRTTVKQGRSNTRMLGFQGPEGLANLNDQDIDDLIVYLRNLPNDLK